MINLLPQEPRIFICIATSRTCAALFALGASFQLLAQTPAASPVIRPAPAESPGAYQPHQPTAQEIEAGRIARPMYAALKLRIDTANGIFSGTMKVETALQKLRTEASPSGLMLEPDADFAYAAIDLGQRLIASGRPDEAGKFFTEAEKALDQAVRKTPDSAARDKAQYLAKLSFLRSSYLNQVTQARLDLDQALALQPGDPKLKRAKDRLPNDPAEMLKKNPQG